MVEPIMLSRSYCQYPCCRFLLKLAVDADADEDEDADVVVVAADAAPIVRLDHWTG